MRKITLVLVAVALVALAGCSKDDPEISTREGGGNLSIDASSNTTVSESSDEEGTARTATKPGDSIEVTEVGFTATPDSLGDGLRGNAAAVLVNKGEDPLSFFEVVFTFNDAAGTPVGTETSYVYYVPPGGTAYAVVDMAKLQGVPTTVKASAIIKDSFMTFDGTSIPLTVNSVGPPKYGDGSEVTGIAENPSPDLLDGLSVNCVLRTGGTVVGGLTTYLDALVPNGSITWDGTSYLVSGAETAECIASNYS